EIDLTGFEEPCVAAPHARHDLERDSRRLSCRRIEERWHEQRREKVGSRNDEATRRRRRVKIGSASQESLDVFQKRVQRTNERLGAWGEHHTPPGPNEEWVAEVVAQLRKRMTHR